MGRDFFRVFPKKSVIGMIHLAGNRNEERVKRALEEIAIFEEEGIHGIIVEDYHGERIDVVNVLNAMRYRNSRLKIGVNILSNPYGSFGFNKSHDVSFVQFDSVQSTGINISVYDQLRKLHPEVVVLGGIRFKYVKPTGKTLEEDIAEGMSRCDAIVTTGEGTGLETPTEKLRQFRRAMGKFPLVVGAGVNDKNVAEQLNIADAAIVGSYFKKGDTLNKVCRENVRKLMYSIRMKQQSLLT